MTAPAIKEARGRVEANLADTARVDWLEKHTVNARVPLLHGSRDLFWAGPDDSFEGENGPSNIRSLIDAEIAALVEGLHDALGVLVGHGPDFPPDLAPDAADRIEVANRAAQLVQKHRGPKS